MSIAAAFETSNPEWVKTYRAGKRRVEAAEAKFDFKLMVSYNHFAQFIDCVKARTKTMTPVEIAHRSQTPGHLGYIASVVGRALKWDAAKQEIIGDEEATKLMSREVPAAVDGLTAIRQRHENCRLFCRTCQFAPISMTCFTGLTAAEACGRPSFLRKAAAIRSNAACSSEASPS